MVYVNVVVKDLGTEISGCPHSPCLQGLIGNKRMNEGLMAQALKKALKEYCIAVGASKHLIVLTLGYKIT